MKKRNLLILMVVISIAFFCYLYRSLFSNKEIAVSVEESISTQLYDISSNEENYVYVYVYGEVLRSGLYYIPSEWVLAQLVELVGVTDEADLSGIGLAKPVSGGSSYYVPKLSDNSVAKSELININIATKSELMQITGIGEVLAERIIAYRMIKAFSSIEEIKNVSGIGDALYEKIKYYITV